MKNLPLEPVLEQLKADDAGALERLLELLRIPSVSADPACRPHIEAAAQWLVGQLSQMGLEARVMPTAGAPVAVATTPADKAQRPSPRLLFYGHYDVQPPDPLDKWVTPPFEPTIRDGAIHARGASDDKGQVCCFLEALRGWLKVHGKLPVPVTVMIEGQEEGGSEEALAQFMAEHRELLAADAALVCDTGIWEGPDGPIPAITYGLRGILYYELRLYGPSHDLHSGSFGGSVPNPATLLARVIGRLLDDDNRVTIPGFYDDVLAATEQEKRGWAKLPVDEARAVGQLGLKGYFGERGRSVLECVWARPTCDVNGLFGGYAGQGAKTIIPSTAGAKVSFRLVPNQDPAKIDKLFRAWLRKQEVGGCRWEVEQLGGARPVLVATDSPLVAAARRALERAAGQPAVLIREGGTIPVVADIKRLLGLDALLVGFARDDDRNHSPNEKFDLAQFDLGRRALAVLLGELAGTAAAPARR